jgi:hypothetical protein
MASELIGAAGVFLLLLAFALNLFRKLSERSAAYLILNGVGAGISAWYAARLGSVPFVILEGVWAGVAWIRLGMIIKRASA